MSAKTNKYKYVKAIVDCGILRWEYKVTGSRVEGRMQHDEDVEGWSVGDIIDVTASMLDVPTEQRSGIEVEYC